jgi:hypothetical protein
VSYVICTKAEILDDGRSVELSFADEHGCSRRTIRMPADEWWNINVYQMAYEEPSRAMMDATRDISRQIWQQIEAHQARSKEQTK